jgi:hypothetical protein
MPKSRGQRKARLMQEAERVIDELLDWSDHTPEPNLSQIEKVVLELRERLSEEMVQGVLEGQEAKQPAMSPPCPKCGQKMKYKDQKEVTPLTFVGEVEIERAYYHCEKCKVGFFPSGPTA